MRQNLLRRSGPIAVAVALAAVLAAQAQDAAPPDDAPASAPAVEIAEPPADVLKSFVAKEVRAHVYFLAGKKCEGRASGTEGCNVAAEYIVQRLKEWGLEPAGDDQGEYRKYRQEMQVLLRPFSGQSNSGNPTGGMAVTYNVCALLPGSDEALKDELVVLSAHYDHVGKKSKKKTFFGADDNASGTSALLQVARALATEGAPRPRRSILFLWFTAEERGLLGSKHWCDNPTLPIGNVVCDLNIDMVGRNASKELHVYGNASSPDLDAAHRKAAETSGFKFLAKTGSIFLRSDQVNFYRKDIPCLFWTSGLHKDYHATSDTAQRIDTKKVARAAQHAYLTAWEIANLDTRPRFVKMDANASSGPLGVILDVVPREGLPARVKLKDGQGAALVRTVMDGSPAAEAKIKAGYFIIAVNGQPLPDGDPISAVEEGVRRARGKKKVVLTIVRGSRTVKTTVKLQ